MCEAHHMKQWETKNPRYIKKQLNEKCKNSEAYCPGFQLGIWPNLGIWEVWWQKVTVRNGMAKAHTDTAPPKWAVLLQDHYCCITWKFCVTSSKQFRYVNPRQNFCGLEAVTGGLHHRPHNEDVKCGGDVLGIETSAVRANNTETTKSFK